MTKANQAYHKRDLYSEVTTRILAELDKGANLAVSFAAPRARDNAFTS
jgi:antirestriction protein ArdC